MTKSAHVHLCEFSCTPHFEKTVKWLKCVIFKGGHDKKFSCPPAINRGTKGGHENVTKLLTDGLLVHNLETFTCPPHVPPVI